MDWQEIWCLMEVCFIFTDTAFFLGTAVIVLCLVVISQYVAGNHFTTHNYNILFSHLVSSFSSFHSEVWENEWLQYIRQLEWFNFWSQFSAVTASFSNGMIRLNLAIGSVRKLPNNYGIIGSLFLYDSVFCKDRLRNILHSQTSKELSSPYTINFIETILLILILLQRIFASISLIHDQ